MIAKKPFLRALLLLVAASLGYLSTSAASDLQEGFPHPPGALGFRKPAVTDLDGDGLIEIIVSRGLDIAVLRHDGSMQAGWPYVPLNRFAGSLATHVPPLVGDIDGDGQVEVVFEQRGTKSVYAVSAQGVLKPGWPVALGGHGLAIDHLCLGDLDGDGDLEVITGDATFYHAIVRAFDGDGQPHPGWPHVFDDQSGFGIAGLAIGDLEFDGVNEIVVAFAGWENGYWIPSPVTVLDGKGGVRPGWPVTLPGPGVPIFMNPVIADLDGDLSCEIIGTGPGRLYVMGSDGTLRSYYSAQNVMTAPHAVGNLDADPALEIVVGGVQLKVIDPVYGVIAEFADPAYRNFQAISLADVNGDGQCEIIAFSNWFDATGQNGTDVFHLLDLSMTPLPGWPKVFPGQAFGGATHETICIADLDGDGDLEVIHNRLGLYVWDVENASGSPTRVEWSRLGHDGHKSHFYHNGNLPVRHYLRGDANRDGMIHISDVLAILGVLFLDRPTPCPAQLDFDASDTLSLADAIGLLAYLFAGAPPPPAPFPICGPAPGVGRLTCSTTECP